MFETAVHNLGIYEGGYEAKPNPSSIDKFDTVGEDKYLNFDSYG
jgi:hypothetical protein